MQPNQWNALAAVDEHRRQAGSLQGHTRIKKPHFQDTVIKTYQQNPDFLKQ